MTATMGLVSIAPVRNASCLSSSASFGSPIVNVAPLRPAAKRNVMITRAALPEEQSSKTARREMLASLMAAGAVIATAGQSFAASGPGTSGAQRTNEKAADLLKRADDLTTTDSPPRYGPGRVGGDDTGRIAQKGGAGAIEELQGAGGGAVEEAKSAVSQAKRRMDGIFGKKTGDVSDASISFDDAAGKVESDIGTTQGKVKSDLDTVQGKGGSFVADAQKNFEGATKGGKSAAAEFVDNIKSVFPQ